jgi:hypothetical protein
LILPIEDNPYLYMTKQSEYNDDIRGDGVIVEGNYYPRFMSAGRLAYNMTTYFGFPDITRLDKVRWLYDSVQKDYVMQGYFIFSDPDIANDWVDIYVKYYGVSGRVEDSPFSDSSSPILRKYVRQGGTLNQSGLMYIMANSERLMTFRALGEYFHLLTNYKYSSFSYVVGGIYTGSSAHSTNSFFSYVEKGFFEYPDAKILISWDYGWQLGGSKPGYLRALPASVAYRAWPEAFAAGQVVPISADYTYSGNRFVTYGTLKMETLYSTASENHWNTSLIIMGDDYEVTMDDGVIGGGGAGGIVQDAVNDESLGQGEGSGSVLVDRPLLFRKFPFSIPYDLSDILSSFRATARAPSFTFPFSAFGAGADATIDLSTYDEVAKNIRIGEIILFTFGLVAAGSRMLGFNFGGSGDG